MVIFHNWVKTIKNDLEELFENRFGYIFSIENSEVATKIINFTNIIIVPTNSFDIISSIIKDYFWLKFPQATTAVGVELYEYNSTFGIIDEENNYINIYIAMPKDYDEELLQRIYTGYNTCKIPTTVTSIYFTMESSDISQLLGKFTEKGIRNCKYYKTYRVIEKVLYRNIMLVPTNIIDNVKNIISSCIAPESKIYIEDAILSNEICTNKYLGKAADTLKNIYEVLIIPFGDHTSSIIEELDNNLISYDITKSDNTELAIHTDNINEVIDNIFISALNRADIKEACLTKSITIIISMLNGRELKLLSRYQNFVMEIDYPEIITTIDDSNDI